MGIVAFRNSFALHWLTTPLLGLSSYMFRPSEDVDVSMNNLNYHAAYDIVAVGRVSVDHTRGNAPRGTKQTLTLACLACVPTPVKI